MKILLVQPPNYYGIGGSRLPNSFPLAIAYVAKVLSKNGFEIEVLDIWGNQYTNEQVLDKIAAADYDAVGVSAMSTQYGYAKWLASEFKKRDNKPVVVGGAMPTLSPMLTMQKSEFDIACIGEGEVSSVNLFKALENKTDLSEVKGIMYRKDGQIMTTPPQPYLENLDDVDFPAWEYFPMDEYIKHHYIYGHPELRTMTIVSSRGCPWFCKFCSKLFKGVRLRSVNNIVAEVKELQKRYGIQAVIFGDELTIINKSRGIELCDKLGLLGIKWFSQSRVNLVDKELLVKMKESGCVAIGYGVESGSQHVLDCMDKRIKVEESIAAVKNTVDAGMTPIIQVMFGFPGENRESIEETIKFFDTIDFPAPPFFIATPLPGTPLYDMAKEKGLITDEDAYLTSLAGGYLAETTKVINLTDFSDDELLKLKRQMEARIAFNYSKRHPAAMIKKYLVGGWGILSHEGPSAFLKKTRYRLRLLTGV